MFLWMEDIWGIPRHASAILSTLSVLFALLAVALQIWCIALFQRSGGGTPSPAVPTTKLVTNGPYRWVRNPMNSGEVILVLSLAGWFGSRALLTYAILAWLAFHCFVVWWEEPRLLLQHGEEYARYKARVQRWVPRRQKANGTKN
jgi:protein-S-isoprenylcysteine O-methyltransferase Ste14